MAGSNVARFTTMLRKEIKEHRWKAIAVWIILMAVVAGLPPMYPFLAEMGRGAGFKQQLQNLPEGFRTQFEVMLGSFESYAYSNLFKNLYQLGMILVLSIGAGLVATELSLGTMGFLASKPATRREILGAKLTAGALLVAGVVVTCDIAMWASCRIWGRSLSLATLLAGSVPVYLGFMLALVAGTILSIIVGDSWKAAGVLLGIAVILGVPGWIPGYQRFSVFHYMQATPVWLEGVFPWNSAIGMLVGILALYALALVLFDRRDL